jgi:hypothetical protein
MNPSRLSSDYIALQDNEFWKLYRERISEHSRSMLNILKSAPIEKVPGIQGQLTALDFVSSLPATLVATLEQDTKL